MATFTQLKTAIENQTYIDAIVKEVQQETVGDYTYYILWVLAINEYDQRYVQQIKVRVKGDNAYIERGYFIKDPAYRKSVIQFLDNAVANITAVKAYDGLIFLNDYNGAEVNVYILDDQTGETTRSRYFLDENLDYTKLNVE